MFFNINVSLIVPIYNDSEHLEKLVEVLHNQTFKDCEFLLINDGSTDNSFWKLKKILNNLEDKRFKVFDKKNGGVSSARNFGLNHALGKYVMFMDADDICDSNYIEEYYKDIQYSNADICFFGIKIIDENKRLKEIPKMEALNKKGVIGASDIIKFYSAQKLRGYPVIYISKKSLWEQVRFNESISYQEDCLALMQLVIRNPNIKAHMNNKVYYSYVMNSKSRTHNMNGEIYKQAMKVNKIICEELKQSSNYSNLYMEMVAHDLTNLSSFIGYSLISNNQLDYSKAREKFISTYQTSKGKIDKSLKIHRLLQYWIIKMNLKRVLFLLYRKKMDLNN